jgi:hypothetical protein
MKRRRWRRAVVVGGAAALGAVVLVGWATAWRRLPAYEPPTIDLPPIMDNAGYAAVIDDHPRPDVYRVGGAVLVFGAEHTRDPADPQLAEIRAAFDAFGPTAALCESRLGVMFPQLMDPVETFGEPGAVHALARRAGIPTWTLEPPDGALVRSLLAQGFTPEQVALYLALRPAFSSRRNGPHADAEGLVADTLGERMAAPGLDGALGSVAEVEAAWRRQFPQGPDWRDVSDEYGLPGYLGALDANLARDEHLVRCAVDLVRRGKRVFIICGSSHAVKIEAALREVLER